MPLNSSMNLSKLKNFLNNLNLKIYLKKGMKMIEEINICQVSLKRDIPLILKNYLNFKNFTNKLQFMLFVRQGTIFF